MRKVAILLTLVLLLLSVLTVPAAAASGKTISWQLRQGKMGFVYKTTLISVDSTSAQLKFLTQKDASTYIKYGIKINNLDQTAYINDDGTYHYGAIKNLTPGTTYYYKIFAIVKNRVIEDTNTYSFTTAPLVSISGLQAYSTTDTKTKFEWFTDMGASCTLYYGTSPDALNNIADRVETYSDTFHNAYAYNLQPSTTYYYMVTTNDGLVKTDIQTFTTLATKPVLIYDLKTYSTTSTATKFEWYTSQPADCILYYGTDPANLSSIVVPWAEQGNLYLGFAGDLQPDTTYYYMVVTKDGSAQSDIQSFTTWSALK